MDISTQVSRDGTLRRHIVRGAFDFEELKAYLSQVYSAPEFDRSIDSLWDLRQADFSGVSSDDVRGMMEFVAARWGADPDVRAALVVSDDLDYGMSRMYQMLLDGATSSGVGVFKNMEEAERWIGREDA